MSTTNRDYSTNFTKRVEAKALASFATAVANANNATGGPTSLLRTQNTDQLASVLTLQNQGKCFCVIDSDPTTRYSFNPSGGPCGCGLSR